MSSQSQWSLSHGYDSLSSPPLQTCSGNYHTISSSFHKLAGSSSGSSSSPVNSLHPTNQHLWYHHHMSIPFIPQTFPPRSLRATHLQKIGIDWIIITFIPQTCLIWIIIICQDTFTPQTCLIWIIITRQITFTPKLASSGSSSHAKTLRPPNLPHLNHHMVKSPSPPQTSLIWIIITCQDPPPPPPPPPSTLASSGSSHAKTPSPPKITSSGSASASHVTSPSPQITCSS